jgi:hypothetical protein
VDEAKADAERAKLQEEAGRVAQRTRPTTCRTGTEVPLTLTSDRRLGSRRSCDRLVPIPLVRVHRAWLALSGLRRLRSSDREGPEGPLGSASEHGDPRPVCAVNTDLLLPARPGLLQPGCPIRFPSRPEWQYTAWVNEVRAVPEDDRIIESELFRRTIGSSRPTWRWSGTPTIGAPSGGTSRAAPLGHWYVAVPLDEWIGGVETR